MAYSSVALLDMPAGRAVDGFEATANTLGLMAERQGDTLRVSLRLGTVDVAGDGNGTRISIASETAAQLQSLRDLLALRLSQRGLHLAWQEGATGRPANMSLARVEGIERISPSYMRVTITGPDLGRFAGGGMHFRLLFGPEGAGWPELDAGGLTQWPGGVEAWHRPVYTTRQIDRMEGDAARIVFDVFLHEGGRVTEWILTAGIGEEIALTGPVGSDPPSAGWIGIVADETAVPVAVRILSEVPASQRGRAVLFVSEADDIQEVAHPEGFDVDWVVRGAGVSPVTACRTLPIPRDDRFLFFAAERGEAVSVRETLSELGFSRKEFQAAAYWTR